MIKSGSYSYIKYKFYRLSRSDLIHAFGGANFLFYIYKYEEHMRSILLTALVLTSFSTLASTTDLTCKVVKCSDVENICQFRFMV